MGMEKLFVIEGNIGAGKTTLSVALADKLNAQLILEEFTDNPFLPGFYENPTRYAFPVELFFMTERHKQLQQMLMQQSLFQDKIIADYFFGKTLLFAGHNLEGAEFRLFNQMFKILSNSFPNPGLMIYLHRPIEELLKNIEKRGRKMEKGITADYLIKVQHSYFNFFKTKPEFPILILDAEDKELIDDEVNFNYILEMTNRKLNNTVCWEKING
jgi:deoxyguanosine kinase